MINFGITQESKLDFLRGDVKSVIIYKQDKKDSHSFYNEDGHRTLRVHFDEDTSIQLKQKSIFNNGFKAGYINYDKYDNQISSGEFELDYDGNCIAKYHDGELEEQFEYNELNQVSIVFYPNTGARDIYQYDQNGLAIAQLSIQGENSMFGSLFGGPKKKLTLFENDNFGNVLVMKVIDYEQDKLLFSQQNKVNSHGDIIETINLNGDGSLYSEMYFEYEYDLKFNWIVKKILDKNGIALKIEKRSVLYNSEQGFDVNHDEINENWKYKFKVLNGKRLSLLYIALSKELFEKPRKGQVFFEANGDGSCTLFFSNEYYPILKSSIDKSYLSGKFAQSNAEADWNDLKYAIDSAEVSDRDGIENLQLYSIYN